MSAGDRAVAAFEIDDVFVVEAKYFVARDFNQTESKEEVTFGHQVTADSECLWQVRTTKDGRSIYILRYFVNADVRLLKAGVQPSEKKPTDEDSLAVLIFKLAVDYRCPQNAFSDQEAIGAFTRNACFHAWPYLREEVHSACGRLRIPRLTIPMFKPDQKPLVDPTKGARHDSVPETKAPNSDNNRTSAAT